METYKICNECGRLASRYTTDHCHHCGGLLVEKEADSCKKCGQTFERHWKFCEGCGSPREETLVEGKIIEKKSPEANSFPEETIGKPWTKILKILQELRRKLWPRRIYLERKIKD